eukprot:RCo055721
MAATTSSERVAPDGSLTELECPVCSLVFRDPRMLPCTHCFCLLCLLRLLKNAAGAGSGFDLPCPYLCPAVHLESLRDLKALPKPRNFSNFCLSVRKQRFHALSVEAGDSPEGPDFSENRTGPSASDLDTLLQSLTAVDFTQLTCDGCSSARGVALCPQCGGWFCPPCARMKDHLFCCSTELDLPPERRAYPFLVCRSRATQLLTRELHSRGFSEIRDLQLTPKHCQCHLVFVSAMSKVGNVSVGCTTGVFVHLSEAVLGEFLPEVEQEKFIPTTSATEIPTGQSLPGFRTAGVG